MDGTRGYPTEWSESGGKGYIHNLICGIYRYMAR